MNAFVRASATIALIAASIVPAAAAQPVIVTMYPQSQSTEHGTVKLTPLSATSTRIEITLVGEPFGARQPAHIHKGTCSNLNPAPAYPLNDIVDGHSSSTVQVGLAALQSGQFSVNAHMSAKDLAQYVACANLSKH